MRFLIAFALFCTAAFCQQAMSEQQIVAVLNGISQHAAKLEPMLQQIRPDDWVAKGASETYRAQLATTLQGITSIQTDMTALVQRPDRMSDGLKALFRVEAMHRVLGSLMGGLRRYQNPALADLIESVAAEDSADIENLQQYLLQLAIDKEDQFNVVDQEAQRCRGILSRQPAAPPASPNRRVQ